MGIVLSGVCFLAIPWIFGVSLRSIFFKKASLSSFSAISVGFVVELALLQFCGWFLVAFRFPAIVFIAEFLILQTGVLLFGWYCLKKHKNKIQPFSKKRFKNVSLEFILLFILFAVLLYGVFRWYRPDADDSFYVSNVALFSQSSQLNPYDSSFGNWNLGTVPMYDFQIWESFLAVYCRIFSVDAATFCHSVLNIVLLIIAISAYKALADCLFEDQRKRSFFLICVLLLFLWQGYSGYTRGAFLLSRLWQGKAVYVNVVYPLMMALFCAKDILRKKSLWVILSIVVLAGISLNPTSMYVIGFGMLTMMLAYAIQEKKAKVLLQIIPSIIWIIFFTLMIYLRTKQYGDQIAAASVIPEHFVWNTFLKVFHDGHAYFFLYAISLIVILWLGSAVGKRLFIWCPLFMLLLVWNPIFGDLIAQYLTKVPSFWRVFWILPLETSISYAATKGYEKLIDQKRYFAQAVFLVATLLALIFPGSYMFSRENSFLVDGNLEKMPDASVCFGAYIESQKEKAVLLGDDTFSTTIRQKYTEIELVFSRRQYVLDLIKYRGDQQQAEERIRLYEFVKEKEFIETEELQRLLEKYHVNWIAVQNDKTTVQKQLLLLGYETVQSEENYLLLYHKW